MRALPVFLLLSCCVSAQTASGPILGWRVEADGRTVRAIFGIPGASRLGASQTTEFRVLRLSPASGASIAVAPDNGMPVIYDLATGTATPIAAGQPNPTGAVWSPNGS